MQTVLCSLLALVAVVGASQAGHHIGPKGCVSLNHGGAGTCLIRTACSGVDIADFEFSFNCVDTEGGVTRHSFGKGGFDDEEEFDTDVRCARCEAVEAEPRVQATPPSAMSAKKSTAVKPVVPEASPAATVAVARAAASTHHEDVAKFGPSNCVSTWLNKEDGHCMMETACEGVDLTGYEFGLICIDAENQPTRHLFGTDSFDHVETFNTLIPCSKCLALDAAGVAGDAAALATAVSSIKDGMENLVGAIDALNQKVEGNTIAQNQVVQKIEAAEKAIAKIQAPPAVVTAANDTTSAQEAANGTPPNASATTTASASNETAVKSLLVHRRAVQAAVPQEAPKEVTIALHHGRHHTHALRATAAQRAARKRAENKRMEQEEREEEEQRKEDETEKEEEEVDDDENDEEDDSEDAIKVATPAKPKHKAKHVASAAKDNVQDDDDDDDANEAKELAAGV